MDIRYPTPMRRSDRTLAHDVRPSHRSPHQLAAPPRGLRGLLAILFLSAGRGTVTGYLTGLACVGVWIACLRAEAPPVLVLFTAAVVLPTGLLVVPVVGVLGGQRLPSDYRQLGLATQMRL